MNGEGDTCAKLRAEVSALKERLGLIETALRNVNEGFLDDALFANAGLVTCLTASPLPMLVTRRDTGLVMFANKAFLEAMGWNAEEIRGKSVFDMGVFDDTDARDKFLGGMTADVSPHRTLKQHPGPDGEMIDFALTGRLVPSDIGDLVLSIAWDVTELQRVQNALFESEARLRGVLDRMNSGVAVYRAIDDGRDFVFTDVNRAAERIDKISRNNVIGRCVTEVFPGIREFGLLKVFQNVWRTGEAASHPVRMYEDNRMVGWRDNSVYKVPSGEIVAVYNDLTDQKRMEEEERRRNREMARIDKIIALGTLVSGVSHEINNPNQFMILNAPLLERIFREIEPILDEYHSRHTNFTIANIPYEKLRHRVPAMLDGILQGSRRIKQITGSLRDFARDDSGAAHETLDINEVIRAALFLTEGVLNRSSDKVCVDLADSLPLVSGNRNRLTQMLVNLIRNAARAVSENRGKVSVSSSLSSDKTQVQILVLDEGVGMPPDVLRQIKDPFFTTHHDEGNAGLGVSVADSVVSEHNGKLSFVSRPNRGTTVEILLPLPWP